MTAEINGQHQTLETIDFVPPDSYHVVAGDDTELIVIGQDYYLKANGSWRKGPAGTQSPSDPAKVISSSAEIAGKVVKGGIGFTSEGERCQLYTYSGKDQSAPVTHVCVSDASVPYQWTTVIGGYNTVIKLSDFDADITITAPSLGP